MLCSECNKHVDINNASLTDCERCKFFLYLGLILRLGVVATIDIEYNRKFYFGNVKKQILHQEIKNCCKHDDVKSVAIKTIDSLIRRVKLLSIRYPREDLEIMMLALRELSIWLKFKESWLSANLKLVSYIYTNILGLVPEQEYGDEMILESTDFSSIFVLVEEIGRIVENVNNTEHFNWNVDLESMLLERISTGKLAWFHKYFEKEEIQWPELIQFKEREVVEYLEKRDMSPKTIKSEIGSELGRVAGFTYDELGSFRNKFIEVAQKNNQIYEISPKNGTRAMEIAFLFKEQLSDLGLTTYKIRKMIDLFLYKATYNAGIDLIDPHLDYKFLLEYQGMLFLGVADSLESINIFENISITDHFINEILDEVALKPFKKAQEKIAILMALKIGLHFSSKSGFFVPQVKNGVPAYNIKLIKGNGVRKHIRNQDNQDLGDVDLVIVDKREDKLILIEIKYYKPTVSFSEIRKKDKKNI